MEKLNELWRTFQAEKMRLEQKILEKEKILEITEDMEDSQKNADLMEEAEKKEGLKEADKRLKRSSLQWFQKLWKKDNIKRRQQMEQEREKLLQTVVTMKT